MEVDLKGGLRSLRESLRQIKSLLAWEELKQAEARPNQPPAFALHDLTEQDLRNEYSFFLSTCVQMHSFLEENPASVSEAEGQKIKRQLIKIEHELYSLNLHSRFLRC